MTPLELKSLAERMLMDYDANSPGTVFGEGLSLSIDEAFQLQSAVANLRQRRGELIIGYKIGCVAPANQRALGVSHPVFGRLWSTEQFADSALLLKSNYSGLGVEAEFGIRLAEDLKTSDSSVHAISQKVSDIFVVIELHNTRLIGSDPRAPEVISNNAIHSGVVNGAKVAPPKESKAIDLSLLMDDEIADSWSELVWPDDVLRAVPWLVDRLNQDNQQLQQGDIILTAAFGPPIPVDLETSVTVISSDFGSVTAVFK